MRYAPWFTIEEFVHFESLMYRRRVALLLAAVLVLLLLVAAALNFGLFGTPR